MDGILPVDKPAGPSSFDIVRQARRALGERAVGHAGTLDPMATGLLIVCVGQGTRLVPYLMDGEKRYAARVIFGVATDTDDAEGAPIASGPLPVFDRARFEEVAARFTGEIEQVPPKYCALKRGGVAAYARARRGEEVRLEARRVRVRRLDLVGFDAGGCAIEVVCGKGTYIRALARDLAVALGTVGHLGALRRIEASGFHVDEAVPFDALQPARFDPARLLPLAAALRAMPTITLDEQRLARVRDGRPIRREADDPASRLGDRAALLDAAGRLAAIAVVEADALRMERVFLRKP